jgi:hypothetical protein
MHVFAEFARHIHHIARSQGRVSPDAACVVAGDPPHCLTNYRINLRKS